MIGSSYILTQWRITRWRLAIIAADEELGGSRGPFSAVFKWYHSPTLSADSGTQIFARIFSSYLLSVTEGLYCGVYGNSMTIP